VTAPVKSRRRSARVLLPWSMWAIIQKFLMELINKNKETNIGQLKY
jgi:hypothetical protein